VAGRGVKRVHFFDSKWSPKLRLVLQDAEERLDPRVRRPERDCAIVPDVEIDGVADLLGTGSGGRRNGVRLAV
jgi:hypothetical protein